MKNLRFLLGFITGAIFVYLFLYLPLKEQENREDAVLDEAMAILDDYEEHEKREENYIATRNRRRRLSDNDYNEWGV